MKQRKNNKQKKFIDKIRTEYLFIIIGFIFGMFFVFTNPPWQSNDEDRHFIHSYYISQGYILPEQGDNKIGAVMPVNIYEIPRRFQGIVFSDEMKISKSKLDEAAEISLNESNQQFYHNYMYNQNPIGYLPSAFGIFIGKVINDNPVWLNWWGRIGDLVFYLIVIFFAIRITPIFKNVLFLYALTPMCIYQGSSITYDAVSISLTFLIFAVVLRYVLDDSTEIGWKEFAFIIILLLIHRYAKNGYPLIPLAFLLIPKDRFKIPVHHIAIYVFFVVFAYILFKLPDWSWKPILSAQDYHLETSKSLKNDLLGNYRINISTSLQNPGKFITDIFNNINHFRQEWAGGTIGRFGYSYTLLPDWFFFIHGLVLIVVAYLDSGTKYILKTWQKTGGFLIGVGSILGIIIMSYFYSPIGASQIFGLQGRYLIHAIPFLLLILYNNKLDIKNWKRDASLVIAVYIVLTLIYTLLYLDGVFYSTP